MGDAPFIIIKNREGTQYKRSARLARFWKHKETGNVVEIRRLLNVTPDNYMRAVFFDPTIGREMSLPLKPRPTPYQPIGAAETQMEPGFLDQYEQYVDQRSTRV